MVAGLAAMFFFCSPTEPILGDINCRVLDDPRIAGRRAWSRAARDPVGGGSLVALLKRMEGCGRRWTDARGSSRPTPISALDHAAKSRAHSSVGERSLHTGEVQGSIPCAPTTLFSPEYLTTHQVDAP